jgi:hypothetical protein
MEYYIVLAKKLPQGFQPEIVWKYIPAFLTYGENISRVVVFMLMLPVPFCISIANSKKGPLLYIGGTIIYFASWLVLIYLPDIKWSNSILGYTASACTPLVWLTGIGLIGNSYYFNLPFKRWIFFSASFIFLTFYYFHTFTVCFRTHNMIKRFIQVNLYSLFPLTVSMGVLKINCHHRVAVKF